MKNEDLSWPRSLSKRFKNPQRLARGRMSTVFKAQEGDRQVAVKVLHGHLRDNPSVRQRLARELATTRRLNHPAILRIDDLIETDDAAAMVMEFVDGLTLRAYVQRHGPQSWEKTRAIIRTIAEALDHAHDRGILHRDLSAHHVMITTNNAIKVVGFGLARVDELVGLTMHTRVLGALESLAPERVLGFSYDGRADIYSLGTLAHELLTGEPLMAGTMSEAFQLATGNRHHALPATIDAGPRYVIERCLARDPRTRFARVSQFLRALDGDYDLARWQAWSARKTKSCPRCSEPIIDGLSHCIHCDFAFKRLVQHPGQGPFMIRILTKYEAFVKDFLFEKNNEPRTFTETQFQNLMEFLKEYDDTAPFADGRGEYFFPPYILLEGLQEEEAHRISEALKERDIDNKVVLEVEKRRFDIEVLKVPATFLLSFLWLMGVVFPIASDPSHLAALILSSLFTFGIGFFAVRLLSPVPEDERRAHRVGALQLMIPTEELSALGRVTGDAILPGRTAETLKGLKDEALRMEIFELIMLTTEVLQSGGPITGAKEILEEVLALGESIAEIDRRLAATPTARLMDQYEVARSRENPSETQQVLQALGDLDDLEERRAELTARLLKVRAALFEHANPAHYSSEIDEVIFDFDEIHSLLQAHEEVEALV